MPTATPVLDIGTCCPSPPSTHCRPSLCSGKPPRNPRDSSVRQGEQETFERGENPGWQEGIPAFIPSKDELLKFCVWRPPELECTGFLMPFQRGCFALGCVPLPGVGTGGDGIRAHPWPLSHRMDLQLQMKFSAREKIFSWEHSACHPSPLQTQDILFHQTKAKMCWKCWKSELTTSAEVKVQQKKIISSFENFLMHQTRPPSKSTKRISEQNHSEPKQHLANQIYNNRKSAIKVYFFWRRKTYF